MNIGEANRPVSDQIKNIIDERGVKQRSIAESAGYTSQELSDMLNGRRLIKAQDIMRICDALGISVVKAFGESAIPTDVSTCDLVDELKTREGVAVEYAEPYRDISVKVNGPAVILVVTD